MPTFRWLHLTDLHWGDPKCRNLWTDNVRSAFLADLRSLRAQIGGSLDLIVFTGDLVFGGTATEFIDLDRWLTQLHGELAPDFGSPLFLAVPGNHDLVRPADAEAERLIRDWHAAGRRTCPPEIQTAFAPYSAWWAGLTLARPPLTTGFMPGDFSATVEKEGFKLGLVGLNSAFLHLRGGDLRGQMALCEEQLEAVCSPSVAGWFGARHVTLLLSHHPESWLKDQHHFKGEVAPAGRFAAHLCGHMHVPESWDHSEGNGEFRRQRQGASLFGLEQVERDGKEEERFHGYNVGILEFDGVQATLRHLPRRAERRGDKSWGFGRDSAHTLVGDTTAPVPLKLHHPAPPIAAAFPPLQQAGSPYDPTWYVDRGVEAEAIAYLNGGASFLVVAPAHYGKTHLIERIVELLERTEGWRDTRTFRVSCNQLDASEVLCLLDHIAQDLSSQDPALLDAWVEAKGRPNLTIDRRFARFFTEAVLRPSPGHVLLVLDNGDDLITKPALHTFMSMLRAWLQNPDFKQLRVILTAATGRYYIDPEARSNWHDLFETIKLHRLTRPQVDALIGRHRLMVTSREIDQLEARVAFHPHLTRFYLYHAAAGKRSLGEVLADPQLKGRVASSLRSWFARIPPEVRAELRRVFGSAGGALSETTRIWMKDADLLGEDGRLRCEAYREVFVAG